jgi:hypothetical protein
MIYLEQRRISAYDVYTSASSVQNRLSGATTPTLPQIPLF